MLLHVLMFWGLLARPAGRSDWPAENYPVRTWRVMRKAGAARRRLAKKLALENTILFTLAVAAFLNCLTRDSILVLR